MKTAFGVYFGDVWLVDGRVAGRAQLALLCPITSLTWTAALRKDSYFQAQYRRPASLRGKKRAAMAVGPALLKVVYHLLADPNLRYREPGGNDFDNLHPERLCRHLVKRLESLGYEVALNRRKAA